MSDNDLLFFLFVLFDTHQFHIFSCVLMLLHFTLSLYRCSVESAHALRPMLSLTAVYPVFPLLSVLYTRLAQASIYQADEGESDESVFAAGWFE